MEDERESGKAGAGNVVWIVFEGDFIGAVFVDGEKSGLGLGDGCDVVIFAGFCADGNAEFVERLMQQVFDCSEACHVVDQLLDPSTGFFNYLRGGARHSGSDGGREFIDAWRHPGLQGETGGGQSRQRINAGKTGFGGRCVGG